MSPTPASLRPTGIKSSLGGSSIRVDILAVSLVVHLLGLALPLALLQIYDRILPSQSFGTASFLVAGVAVAIFLEAVLRYGRQIIFAGIGSQYEARTTMMALERLQHADILEIEERGSAGVSDAIRSIAQVRDFWSGQAGASLYEAPFVIVYIALIAYVGGWLAIIPLALFVLAIIIVGVWTSSIRKAARRAEDLAQRRRDFTWGIFSALGYLKCIGAEEGMIGLWRQINARFMAENADLERRMGWVRENATSIGQLSTVLIVTFGAVEVINGNLTTGALAACTMLAGRSIGPAMASLGYWSQLARLDEAQSKVDDILSLPDAPTYKIERDIGAPQITKGEVYIDAPQILREPVAIKPGEIVHLRTTDTPLASRLLVAISGMSHVPDIDVKVDGTYLIEFNHADYREAVMHVSNHLALVPGSILNNLTLYDPRYNAVVQNYCEKLGLQPHLDKLRNGILTDVGPGTAEHLDEGIYQRIAIIRALIRKPRILLLDHAANGIDLDGVKKLAEVLKELRGDTTVLMTTFKEPLVEVCDRQIDIGDVEPTI